MTCGVGMQQMTMSAFIGFRPEAAIPPSASANGIARDVTPSFPPAGIRVEPSFCA